LFNNGSFVVVMAARLYKVNVVPVPALRNALTSHNTKNDYALAPFRPCGLPGGRYAPALGLQGNLIEVQHHAYHAWALGLPAVVRALYLHFASIIIDTTNTVTLGEDGAADVIEQCDTGDDYSQFKKMRPWFATLYAAVLPDVITGHWSIPRVSGLRNPVSNTDLRLLRDEHQVHTTSLVVALDATPALVSDPHSPKSYCSSRDVLAKVYTHWSSDGCATTQPAEVNAETAWCVFVRYGCVVGVSQLYVKTVGTWPRYMAQRATQLVDAFQRIWDEVVQTTTTHSLEPRVSYEIGDWAFDATAHFDAAKNIVARLVKINGSGFGWGPVSSSLFSWRDDPPPQLHMHVVHVRYVVPSMSNSF
jgi:hypothetical protein